MDNYWDKYAEMHGQQNVKNILYCTCSGYSCLPEDEPSGQKHVQAEDIVKNYIKL